MIYKEAYEILHPETYLRKLAEIEYYGGFSGEEAVRKAIEDARILACEAILDLQLYKDLGTLPELRESMRKYKEQQDDLK